MNADTPYFEISPTVGEALAGEIVERRPDHNPLLVQVYKRTAERFKNGDDPISYEGVWWREPVELAKPKLMPLLSGPDVTRIPMETRQFILALAMVATVAALGALLIIGVTWR